MPTNPTPELKPVTFEGVDLRIELPLKPDCIAGSIIWTNDMQRFCDLRGWGYLIGTGGLHLDPDEAEKIQDARGRFLVHCVNTHSQQAAEIEALKAEVKNLQGWMNFYGIEVTEDGGTKFKPSTMDKWRKIQADKEDALEGEQHGR